LAIDTVVLPDIMIILKDRFDTIANWGIEGSPSLLAEITSTHTEYRDRALKPEIYALYDVPEYWIVEPDHRHFRIFSDPRDGRYRAECTVSDAAMSATIPGLKVDLATIFAPMFGD
jgi:Uma2 family endonuclease